MPNPPAGLSRRQLVQHSLLQDTPASTISTPPLHSLHCVIVMFIRYLERGSFTTQLKSTEAPANEVTTTPAFLDLACPLTAILSLTSPSCGDDGRSRHRDVTHMS